MRACCACDDDLIVQFGISCAWTTPRHRVYANGALRSRNSPGSIVNTQNPPSGQQSELDEALAGTFPASDPVTMTSSTIATAREGPDLGHPGAPIVEVFRVVHRDQATQPFSRSGNEGGGRWTSPGVPAIYASTTPAGAVLEFVAHLDGEAPVDLVLVKARMPPGNVEMATSLPAQWRELPYRGDVREYGNSWIAAAKSLALNLPSVLCEQSRNLLINPAHENITQLVIENVEAFVLDKRLSRREASGDGNAPLPGDS